MSKQIKFKIDGDISEDQKYLIEAEFEVEEGIESAKVDTKNKYCEISFDENKISEKSLVHMFRDQSIELIPEGEKKDQIKEYTLYVDGMHCSSCEILIEKSLLKMEGIKAIDASANKGEVLVEYTGEKPRTQNLNKIFKKDGYKFGEKPNRVVKKEKSVEINKDGQILIDKKKLNNFLIVFAFSILLIIGFLSLHKSGIASYVNVTEKSTLPMFFFFGLLAGFSSCAALVGGIVLSMSRQWMDNFSSNDSNLTKLQPHLLFNAGRLISYAVLGAILGAVGSFFQLSLTFTSLLVLGVSVMMIFLGLQMLGVSYFQKFQLSLPKFITRYIADESNFTGKYMPVIMGALTFFLPCGFTITAQGLALTSGNMFQGSMIMFMFALGTVPSLMTIGISTVTFSKKPHIAERFMKIAGTLVIFFAMFNINAQMNVLGFTSIEDISFGSSTSVNVAEASDIDGLPPIVDGVQVLKMDAASSGYSPNKLKIRSGVPVRWEITDKGTSGCTNAIISKSLFSGQIALTPGQTSTKEFTADKAGKYKFSCWMGMVSGTIDVVDVKKNGEVVPLDNNAIEVSSGAQGCGCGGSGSGSGSGTCGGF